MKFRQVAQGIALVATLGGGIGCSVAPSEATGRSSSKLLAPRPFLKVSSSSATRAALGVTEWRMFGGRSKQVLTGYNASGKAVRGVELGFVAHTKTTRAHVAVRHLDGSGFAFAVLRSGGFGLLHDAHRR